MSSKKPKAKKKEEAELPESEHIRLFVLYMDTFTKHRIECFCCGAVVSERDVGETTFAKRLHKQGWRWMDSRALQTSGQMCPKCVRLPDKTRPDIEYEGDWLDD